MNSGGILMDIRYIGQTSVALFLDSEDLKARHMDACSIDLKQAAELLDIEGWECAEFELFAGQDSILLIAWDRSLKPFCFAFDNFEQMISAVSECRQDQLSKLIYCDGQYILTVYPEKDKQPCPALYEYGEVLGSSEGFVLHLEEHGEILIPKNAIKLLKSILRP
jgi:negative regulator of genetic competence, sporulation and motility